MLRFRPRLIDELQGYDRSKLASDLSAGLPQPQWLATKSGLVRALGPDNVVGSLADAWRRARQLS